MSIRTPSRVCCDANLVVRFLTQANGSAAHDLWTDWIKRQTSVLAPILLRFEVTNAFHRLAKAGNLTVNQAESALDAAWMLPIVYDSSLSVHRRALAMSRELDLPAAYDAHYLALAELERVELFTSDRRLYNAAHRQCPWIRLVE